MNIHLKVQYPGFVFCCGLGHIDLIHMLDVIFTDTGEMTQ